MVGKFYNAKGALWAWVGIFVGFNLTFFPQFILGTHGMPRRYADWSREIWIERLGDSPDLERMLAHLDMFSLLHKLSTIGSYVQLIGFLILAWVLVRSLVKGRPAPRNPWGGNSLEWHTPSPPPHENFADQPEAEDGYDFTTWHWDPEIQGFVRREPEAKPQPDAEPKPAQV